MADRFTYRTGISEQPIDFVSGGQRLMQAAVEQKLADIEADRLAVTESTKDVLKAMSLKTTQGLTRGLQEKYQKEIDDYHKKITDMHVAGSGKLSRPQRMEIQQGFQELEQRQLQDVAALKERDTMRKLALDPNSQYAYNIEGMLTELRQWDKAFEKGEYLGDPRTIGFKHQLEPSVSDYVAKRYDDAISRLGVEALGEFKGNVFTSTTVQNREEVERLRDAVMQDPNVRRRYTANDGTIFEDKRVEVQRGVEDYINRKITEVKPYRQTIGRGVTKDVYVSYEPDTEKIQEIGGEISSTYGATVPTTGVTSFSHEGDRVAVESIVYHPVAVSEDAYYSNLSGVKKGKIERMKKLGEKSPDVTVSKDLIIDDKDLGKYKEGQFEYKPFAKLVVPKEKGLYFRTLEDLAGKDTEVKFAPFEGKVKSAIAGKMGTKRDAYFQRIEEANKRLQTGAREEVAVEETTYTIDGVKYKETEALTLYKGKYPNRSDEELLKAMRKLK